MFRGVVRKIFKPRSSYHKAVGSRNYSKTRRAIRAGTFRGYYFRNGKGAPR